MARKELTWKRNTTNDSKTIQNTLSRLSSIDKQTTSLELINTVEPTVQATAEQTIQQPVDTTSTQTVQTTVKQTIQQPVEATSTQITQEALLAIETDSKLQTSVASNQPTKTSATIPTPLVIDNEKEQEYLTILSKLDPAVLKELANTHKETEHHIYLVMYCESRKHNSKDRYFSGIEIAKLIGLKHRRNVMDVLQRLEMKKSISVLTSKPGEVLGKEYRVYEPQEVIERRKKSKMRIHPQTKKIV